MGSSLHPSATETSLGQEIDRKSTRLNSSHSQISYAVFCLKKKKEEPDASPAPACGSQTHLPYLALRPEPPWPSAVRTGPDSSPQSSSHPCGSMPHSSAVS